MIIPVRCFTCGKVVGNLWETYEAMIREEDLTPCEALDELHLKRYCCRRMILSHIDNVDHYAEYSAPIHATMPVPHKVETNLTGV